MSPLRIWILVVLCLLLPIRGAVAASMAPLPGGMAHCEQMQAEMPMSSGMDMSAGDDASDEVLQSHDVSHDAGASDSHKCGHCCDICSATPMLGNAPADAVIRAAGKTGFPALLAPAASFFSGGQERPPRST